MRFDLSAYFAFGVEKCRKGKNKPSVEAGLRKIFTKQAGDDPTPAPPLRWEGSRGLETLTYYNNNFNFREFSPKGLYYE